MSDSKSSIKDVTLARCASHAGRERLASALRREPVEYVSYHTGCVGGFFRVRESELDVARELVGVSIVRDASRFHVSGARMRLAVTS